MLTLFPTNEQMLWRLVPADLSSTGARALARSTILEAHLDSAAADGGSLLSRLEAAVTAAAEHDNPSYVALIGEGDSREPAVAVLGVIRDVGEGRHNPEQWPGAYVSRHLGTLHRRVVRDAEARPQVQYWANLDDRFSIAISFRTANPSLDLVLLNASERLVDDLTMGTTSVGAKP